MTDKLTWPCPGKPEDLKGQPIGMYHCEFCGEMQIAGMAHLPPQFPSQWQEPFPKVPDPPPAPLNELLRMLHASADAEDSAEVCFFLEEVMRHPAADQQGVWEALYIHQEDRNAAFILEYVVLTEGEDGRWTAELRSS